MSHLLANRGPGIAIQCNEVPRIRLVRPSPPSVSYRPIPRQESSRAQLAMSSKRVAGITPPRAWRISFTVPRVDPNTRALLLGDLAAKQPPN
eukprot:6487002-Amphidinium_carterae.2